MEHPLVGRVGRADVARLEPFQMYQSPPTEVQILRFRQSDAHSLIRSFVRSLIAQKSIQGNVQNCHKEEEEKRGKEVRLESERRRKENVSGIGIHSLARYHSKESDNITYERGPIFDLQILRQTFISSIL